MIWSNILLSPRAMSIPKIKYVAKIPVRNATEPRTGRLPESNIISGKILSGMIEVLSTRLMGVRIRIIVFIY